MCESLRFGLIRELRLGAKHFHCVTDGSTKLDYDKCISIFMKSSLNERLASEALVIFGSLIAEFMFGKVSCAGFLSSSVLVSSVQLPTSMSDTGGIWDNAKKDISTSEHVPMVLTQRVNMLMTSLKAHAHFSSFVTCMRCGGDVSPLIGATATSTNEAFCCNGRDCHPTRAVHNKTADFRSPTMFFHAVATKKL